MTDTLRQTIGKYSEQQAKDYLIAQGLQLLTANFRSYSGEIDLIMQDKNIIVFVEVRTRNRTDYGSALESVTRNKQHKIIKTAEYFLQQKKLLYKVLCRFDIITIESNREPKLQWIKNAFTADYFS